jgi:glycine oxidase
MKPATSSVIVIGAGVFGCATAFRLARRGIKTVLIDRDDIGEHASGKNPGNLNPIHGSPPALLPFALRSFHLHRVLAAELADLGCPGYALQPVKRVFLAFDEAERNGLEEIARAFAEVPGFAASWLSAESVLRLDPRLSADVHAGLLVEGNMSVDSRAFNRALAEGAARLGATFLRGRVTGMEQARDRITGVRTSNGTLACEAVVLATGPWQAETREWLGHDLPVSPVKGELLRMRLPGAGLHHDFTRGMISLYRRGSDECWIGVTKEHAGLDELPTEAGRERLLEAAARIMPAVRQATLLEHTAALRPMSASGLPMAGRIPGWGNAYIANGGGIKGILLCSGISQAVADMILGGDTEMPANMRIT